MNISLNVSSQSCKIFTINLPKDKNALKTHKWEGNDYKVAEESITKKPFFVNTKYEKGITQILCDTMNYDFSDFSSKVQYIFIDANHSKEYVQKDTENSLNMLGYNSQSCIIWHDYENIMHPDLTEYINKLSNYKTLYHIEETMLVLLLNKLEVSERIS